MTPIFFFTAIESNIVVSDNDSNGYYYALWADVILSLSYLCIDKDTLIYHSRQQTKTSRHLTSHLIVNLYYKLSYQTNIKLEQKTLHTFSSNIFPSQIIFIINFSKQPVIWHFHKIWGFNGRNKDGSIFTTAQPRQTKNWWMAWLLELLSRSRRGQVSLTSLLRTKKTL